MEIKTIIMDTTLIQTLIQSAKDLIEEAHMQGQRNATVSSELPNGIDPSYSEAVTYYQSLFPKEINLSNDDINLDKFNSILPGTIFAQGTIANAPHGLYMTNSNIGKSLLWIAKKGYGNDWSIYTHWEDRGLMYVVEQGDKVTGNENIKKLVSCSTDVFKLYRF